nr:MAG TPA: hypothetical protein [Caudoviricetes sp.]
MYGKFIYSCLIQYLLNDLYSGIKKEPFTKSEWLLHSLKKEHHTTIL